MTGHEGTADTFIPNWGPVEPIGFVPGKLRDGRTFCVVDDWRIHGVTPVCAGDAVRMRDGSPGIVLAFRQMKYPGGTCVIVAKCPLEAVCAADAITGGDRVLFHDGPGVAAVPRL